MSFDGAAFYELRDGKACRIRVVYDVASILRQMGVLPRAGSRGERMMTTTANAMTRIRKRQTHKQRLTDTTHGRCTPGLIWARGAT